MDRARHGVRARRWKDDINLLSRIDRDAVRVIQLIRRVVGFLPNAVGPHHQNVRCAVGIINEFHRAARFDGDGGVFEGRATHVGFVLGRDLDAAACGKCCQGQERKRDERKPFHEKEHPLHLFTKRQRSACP